MLLWKNRFKIILLFPFFILPFLYQVSFVNADELAQIPTGSIPTVTGTPIGAIAVVLDNDQGFVNVRAGPSTVGYEIIGVLVAGQQVPALGRSTGGDWIKIAYPGVPGGVAWIWSDLVDIRGSLTVVEPP
ncbi:MAG: SH3 domain-containing protein, partial [Anaerolineales bacterium]